MKQVNLCSFNKETGWRVVGNSYSDYGVGVFKFGSIRLLKLPSSHIRPGRFLNPKKELYANQTNS